jgi:hypothetical protein
VLSGEFRSLSGATEYSEGLAANPATLRVHVQSKNCTEHREMQEIRGVRMGS